MGIEFLNGGFYTTVQDAGRHGYQQFGMPVSGAMDLYSMRLGNLLVGNDWNTECLEVTVLGPKIRFTKSNFFAVTGGECSVTLSGVPIQTYKAYLAQAGDVLELSAAVKGSRIYLCFAGGFSLPSVMGSKSTYVKGKIGGIEGRACKAGDILSFASPKTALSNQDHRRIPYSMRPSLEKEQTVRVILGPQEDAFSQVGIDTLLTQPYQVCPDSDRMGYRLEGPVIEHAPSQDGNIISDAISFGAIQVPGHGKPIIMMAERQTTGGYTKIGVVISADLPKVAQMKAGDVLRFAACSVEEAQAIYREQDKQLHSLKHLWEQEMIEKSADLDIQVNGKPFSIQISELA
ncbi:MAG: biotin-dependent carboxyltransferase family protein [Massiliimalia sp.]